MRKLYQKAFCIENLTLELEYTNWDVDRTSKYPAGPQEMGYMDIYTGTWFTTSDGHSHEERISSGPKRYNFCEKDFLSKSVMHNSV